MITSFKEVTLL